jgi:iron-sulfur cluster repair protein YtfE (RIC family)
MSDSKSANKPLNMYAGIHKGQRSALFQLSTRAGVLDNNDKKDFQAFRNDLAAMRDEIKEHIKNEETYVHPFLIERVPGAAQDLEDDHRDTERMLDELVNHFDGIMGKSIEFDKLFELGLEFYRALNRFITHYLVHINKEEEYIQPALWFVCTGDEL